MATLTLKKVKKTPSSQMTKLSIGQLAYQMVKLFDTLQTKHGDFSLQVYIDTNGKLEESRIDSIVEGPILHYRPDIRSHVSIAGPAGTEERDVVWWLNDGYHHITE